MPGFGSAVAWMIFTPLALITDLIGIAIILHYKPLFHSCDVAFISLLVTMATNAWLLLPIPAVMELGDFYWSKDLCSFYTWLSIMLRSSHLIVLLALNVYWMASLRMSSNGYMFTSSKFMKAFVIGSWFSAIIIGMIPVTGGTKLFPYYEDDTCKFLPSDVSTGFAVFFIIVSLLSAVMGFISTLDTLLIFQRMKDVALTKYNAARFHIPTVSGVAQSNVPIHAKYNELNLSIELCRLVLIYSVASAVVNALPLMVSQFVQLTQSHDREAMESTLLWLLLFEALALPHLLWLLSKRYRHAIVYTWRVFVLRDANAKEEDVAACTLQAFRLHAKDTVAKPYRNGMKSLQANGTAHGPTIEDFTTDLDEESSSSRQGQDRSGPSGANGGHGSKVMVTDLDDGLPTLTSLTSKDGVIVHQNKAKNVAGTASQNPQMEPKPRGILKTKTAPKKAPRVFITETNLSESQSASSTPNSPAKSPLTSSGHPSAPVKRSASASSRREWKERMRKKHLPAIFVNESYDDDRKELAAVSQNDDMTARNRSAARKNPQEFRRDASIESTYYMSSDYHYDYLSNNSLPRGARQLHTMESEGVSDTYDADDIGNILDDSFVSEHSVTQIHGRRRSSGNTSSPETHNTQIHMAPLHNSNTLQNQRTVHHSQEDAIGSEVDRQDEDSGNALSGSAFQSANILGVFYDDSSPADSHSFDQNDGAMSNQENFSDTHNNNNNESLPRPNIRRDNYRKFLSYTNLVVSNVDDLDDKDGDETAPINDDNVNYNEVDNDIDHDEEVTTVNTTDSTSNASHSPESVIPDLVLSSGGSPEQEHSSKHPQSAIIHRSPVHSHDSVNMNEENDKQKDLFSGNAALQDYDQLETVSGTEMLHLKMKSVRSATAMEYSDDTTSEEGGVENKGFSEDSVDDEDDKDPAMDKDSLALDLSLQSRLNQSSTPKVSPARRRVKQKNDAIEEDSEVEESLNERDGNADGKEASPEIAQRKSPDAEKTMENLDDSDDEDGKLPHATQNMVTKPKKANLNNNPFFSESFEALAQSPDYKNRFQSKKNPFFHSTDSTVDSTFGSMDDELDESTNTNIDNSGQTEKMSILAGNISSSITDAHLSSSSEKSNSHSANINKPIVPFIKPPRHRRESHESRPSRTGSSEDELSSILGRDQSEDKGMNATDQNMVPQSLSRSQGLNDAEFSSTGAVKLSPNPIDNLETESNESEHSVIIEPYGQRKPPWMDESLTSSSGSTGQYGLDDHSQRDAFGNPTASTDFRFSVTSEDNSTMEEYDFDSVNIGDVSSIYRRPPPYRAVAASQPPLVQYHFDEDIDRGFEDALAVDYIVHSNAYSGLGLCFESIKEEPEDSLSESTSSFGLTETNPANMFKTHAIVSRPSSRASVTGPSPLEVASSPFDETASMGFDNGVYFNENDVAPVKATDPFPAFERTSADGSEEIVLGHNGHAVSTPNVEPNPWDIRTNTIDPNSQVHNDRLFSPKSPREEDLSFETADDLQTSLAVGAEGTHQAMYDSPWLDLEQTSSEPNLDMSFDSDFSQKSRDGTLQTNDIYIGFNDEDLENAVSTCEADRLKLSASDTTSAAESPLTTGSKSPNVTPVYF